MWSGSRRLAYRDFTTTTGAGRLKLFYEPSVVIMGEPEEGGGVVVWRI